MSDRQRKSGLGRRDLLLGVPAVLGIATASQSSPLPKLRTTGRYRIEMQSVDPLRFAVTADLPADGDNIVMPGTYPAELPEMLAGGWPTLISGLTATDSSGRSIALAPLKDAGWRLSRPVTGQIRLNYIVSFDLFAKAGWPSPRESAIADDSTVAVCARALFPTTALMTGADVQFDVPRGWRVAAPWPVSPGSPSAYHAATKMDLTDNFIVVSTRQPDVVTAAGFRLQITAMGHWRPLRPLVRSALQAIVAREVALMGFAARETYNVVLLPMPDTGGEAYRQSFVYAFKDPSPANRGMWANTMAHEIFHYWNAARMRGADYASTQWFQEGFTEYVANLAVVGGGIINPDSFRTKLGGHVANARRLTTTLEAIGTRKGPPLYSAGALVAFSFDVMIRKATNGRRDIGTFFRNLWRYTGAGERNYAWNDIEAALRGAAELDWRDYYLRHIKGSEALPLDRIFRDAGLILRTANDGSVSVASNPSASATQIALWTRIIS